MKTCTKCERDLDPADFCRDRSTADGLRRWCRSCSSDHARRYHADNRATINDRKRRTMKARYDADPTFFTERTRQWRRDNPEVARACDRRKYEKRREDHIAAVLEWQAKNPEKVREYARASEHRRREAPGAFTSEQAAARVRFWGERCWLCGEPGADTLDHVKPISKGGAHWPCNLRPACGPCNSSKHAAWPVPLEPAYQPQPRLP